MQIYHLPHENVIYSPFISKGSMTVASLNYLSIITFFKFEYQKTKICSDHPVLFIIDIKF